MMTLVGTGKNSGPIIPHKTLKTGFSMPEYGLGTWKIGGTSGPGPQENDAADIASVRAAIERGVKHIDTAEMYAGGHSEEIVGRAIEGSERSELFISTKAWNPDKSYEEVLAACEASLGRLSTGYIDLYILHRFVPEPLLSEQMRALDDLYSEGKIRAIGVSNFSPESLAQAQRMTKNRIVYDQVHYNLEFREPERRGLLQYCQENDVLLAAWRPVQKGSLLRSSAPVLHEMSLKYGKTTAQIAINWLVSQMNVITISKTSSAEHLEENLGALGWRMESADIERLREEFPGQKDVSDSAALY